MQWAAGQFGAKFLLASLYKDFTCSSLLVASQQRAGHSRFAEGLCEQAADGAGTEDMPAQGRQSPAGFVNMRRPITMVLLPH